MNQDPWFASQKYALNRHPRHGIILTIRTATKEATESKLRDLGRTDIRVRTGVHDKRITETLNQKQPKGEQIE